MPLRFTTPGCPGTRDRSSRGRHRLCDVPINHHRRVADLKIPWPPEELRTARLTLRATKADDRENYIDLLASREVRQFLGGALDRDELAQAVPAVPGAYPGNFAVVLDARFIGLVSLDRRDIHRPGHLSKNGNEVELSYTFQQSAWGHGYATEACFRVLSWIHEQLPDEPVVLCTQVANGAALAVANKLGFVEVERFDEFGSPQWFGVRSF
jgi:RimJ/RimL family protein N-acetyltransferase